MLQRILGLIPPRQFLTWLLPNLEKKSYRKIISLIDHAAILYCEAIHQLEILMK